MITKREEERDILVHVTLAKIPQADLIKVVQPDGLGDAVDEARIGHRGRDDVGQVELEEVDALEDGFWVGVADEDLGALMCVLITGMKTRRRPHQDEENEGKEIAKGCAQGEPLAQLGHSLQGGIVDLGSLE